MLEVCEEGLCKMMLLGIFERKEERESETEEVRNVLTVASKDFFKVVWLFIKEVPSEKS